MHICSGGQRLLLLVNLTWVEIAPPKVGKRRSEAWADAGTDAVGVIGHTYASWWPPRTCSHLKIL